VRYALRTLPTHPSRLAGDIVPLGRNITTREHADRIRREWFTSEHYEVVPLDDDGEVTG
jgi:hypothetical protein